MNFGSQTFSASCFDVTGAVAPLASAKSSTGIRYRLCRCMTSSHHGCSQRGLVLQPLLRQVLRTAIRIFLSVMTDGGGCASTNPVEDVVAIEPPSSNAEPLRDQQPAQVRAADSLLVAADEVRYLEGRQ